MKLDNYRKYIRQPISTDLPQGEAIVDHIDYDYIESQLMKVGSLSHESIEWQLVEKKTIALLTNKTKDFKLLSALIQVMQYQTTPERYVLSLNLIADFVKDYWPIAHPFKGARGATAKNKLLKQIIDRSINAFDMIDLSLFDSQDEKELEESINYLTNSYAEHKIPVMDIERLILIKQRFSVVVKSNKTENTSMDKEGNDDSSQSTSVTLPKTKVAIDSFDERALKKTLNQISGFFDELGKDALSIQTKRLALWHTIHIAPPYKADGETELASVPIDKISEYREQFSKPNKTLWEKIEQSIMLSPFWFDGHYYSYQVAKALGNDDVAYVIKQALKEFLDRIPELKILTFKGRMPFLSDEAKTWIEKETATCAETDGVKITMVDDRQKEAQEKLIEEGFDETIKYIHNGLSKAINLRDEVYWRLTLADIFISHSLPSLAVDIYQSSLIILTNTTISDWEPELLDRVNRQLKLLKI